MDLNKQQTECSWK